VVTALSEEVLTLIPIVLLFVSLAAAVLIFPMKEHQVGLRSTVNIGLAVVKVVLVMLLFPVVLDADLRPEFSMPFLGGIELVLRVDPLALYFATLSSVLWLITTIYAIGYLQEGQSRSKFFGFFSLCVTATVGISFSGNLITFLVFYEMLTLVTYPLVAHWGDKKSLRAARVYLAFTLSGGLALLFGVVWLTIYAGPVDFAPGGALGVAELAEHSPGIAIAIFVLLVGGFGVKAALFPLHAWLPKAMVAPAPVSALLHAVAVVKAGVFGIVRVLDDVYGIEVAAGLGVLPPLLILAGFTVIYGSYQALRQTDLKARLAYSTISQVNYITVGLALATVTGVAGALTHLVHQGVMKITLFFCAGLYAEVLGAKDLRQLRGLGRRMPGTSVAFTIGAFGMIGLPATAGFISKFQLGLGALDSEYPWVVAVFLASSVMNSMYFLPVVYRLWFQAPEPTAEEETLDRVTEPKSMLYPALITAAGTLAVGLVASAPFMPLDISRQIAEGVFQ
jgi:multicomponent Na+:H+ antiporter subunit D